MVLVGPTGELNWHMFTFFSVFVHFAGFFEDWVDETVVCNGRGNGMEGKAD